MIGSKVNPGMVSRFSGKNGKTRLIDALLRQTLISGNVVLARRFAAVAELVDVRSEKEITKQGGNDNDLYFILTGTVSIRINGREVATRSVGEHVGEMAMIDSTARRSASVVALDTCTLARVKELSLLSSLTDILICGVVLLSL
jgi:CRP-like cAMP-binding protein